jgi:DNA (cytosine-5)-methyltransferase 1
MTKAYYNENDPKAAAWLRQLIHNGDIAKGEVDERSITEIASSDLVGFTQHHFFAGIGGWSYALRLSGWPDDKPVWTGSCPCQPFSAAGKNKGTNDERHLWPHFFRLISEHKPDTIFGEQVEGAIKHGWLDDLQTDLEREGYAVGHCVLGAHSVNAAHIRQRLYWVANSVGNDNRRQIERVDGKTHSAPIINGTNITESREFSGTGEYVRGMADANKHSAGQIAGDNGKMCCIQTKKCESENGAFILRRSSEISRMGNTKRSQLEREFKGCRKEPSQNSERQTDESSGSMQIVDGIEWIYCRDNKYRPIKPGVKPLVDGLPKGMVYSSDSIISPNETHEARVVRLKGYGNAIVPAVAAEFIKAANK